METQATATHHYDNDTCGCIDCYAADITADGLTSWTETCCPGCRQWESTAVPVAALHAYRQGELTEREAFPDLSSTQRTLIECGWHPDCWDHAAMPSP